MHFPLRAIPSLFFLSPSLLTSPVFESLQYCDAVGVSFPLRSGRDLRRHLTTASGTPFASHDLPDHLRKYSRFHPIHNVHRIDDAEDAVPAVRVLDEVSVEHDDASVTAPLFQGMGTHYADVWVGTPPQRKSVIVDTGSHYTAFPCVGCTKCGEEYHTDKYFDPTKSSTYKELGCGQCQRGVSCDSLSKQCPFSQSYSEGSSWHATQVVDMFYVGATGSDPSLLYSSLAFYFMFGCQKRETGLFITQLADGIMGMSADSSTLVKQLYDKKRIQHNMFSLCYGRSDEYSKEGVYSGSMTIGASNDGEHTSPMVYASNTQESGWYTVYVEAVYLREAVVDGRGGASPDNTSQKIQKINIERRLVNSGKGVIVDSGTTDTYLSSSLERPFREAFKKFTGKDLRIDGITQDELEKMPTILFQLKAFNRKDTLLDPKSTPGLAGNVPGLDSDPSHANDVIFAMPPWHYMEYNEYWKTWSTRFYMNERSGGVLGASFMNGHDILFDWENHRIGFAESNCSGSASERAPVHEDVTNIFDWASNGTDFSFKASTNWIIVSITVVLVLLFIWFFASIYSWWVDGRNLCMPSFHLVFSRLQDVYRWVTTKMIYSKLDTDLEMHELDGRIEGNKSVSPLDERDDGLEFTIT